MATAAATITTEQVPHQQKGTTQAHTEAHQDDKDKIEDNIKQKEINHIINFTFHSLVQHNYIFTMNISKQILFK